MARECLIYVIKCLEVKAEITARKESGHTSISGDGRYMTEEKAPTNLRLEPGIVCNLSLNDSG